MKPIERDTQHCIEACLRCYEICFGAAMNHCLEQGGEHVEPRHYRLMKASAEIYRACAHILLLSSPLYRSVCRACAEICEQCAHNCDRLGDMQDCAEACRRCVEHCRKLAEQ
jgi:hypothetical protein